MAASASNAAHLVRRKDWENQLNAYFVWAREQAWGDFDCARFCAGAVEAQTGINLDLPDYSDAESAAAALREAGAGTLEGYLEHWFGPPRHPSAARRGDIVEFSGGGNGLALGIVFNRLVWVLGEKGFVTLPPKSCDRAWCI